MKISCKMCAHEKHGIGARWEPQIERWTDSEYSEDRWMEWEQKKQVESEKNEMGSRQI